MYGQVSNWFCTSEQSFITQTDKRYNSDFHLMTKKAKVQKTLALIIQYRLQLQPVLLYKVVQALLSHNAFSSFQVLKLLKLQDLQNAYSQQSASALLVPKTGLSIRFLKFLEQKSTTSSCLVVP